MKLLIALYCVTCTISLCCCHQQSNNKILKKKDLPNRFKNDLDINQLHWSIYQYPDSVAFYDTLINKLTEKKEYAEAASIAGKLIDRGADSNFYYWFIKGDLFRHANMYDSAIFSYQAFLKKFPDDEAILLNLANTYAEAGDIETLHLTEKITNRFPHRQIRSEAFFINGVYYNQIKKYAEARKWLDSTILLNYNYAEAYMEKGYSYFDEKKYKEALITFSTLTKLNNSHADGWYWKAKCEEILGYKQKAIESYTASYSIDSSITEAKEATSRLSNN